MFVALRRDVVETMVEFENLSINTVYNVAPVYQIVDFSLPYNLKKILPYKAHF